MMDLSKLKINSKILYRRKYDNSPFKVCKVVCIIKALEIPNTKKIIKYYGEKIIDPKYGRVFGPMKTDRLILRKDGIEDDYIILHVDNRTFNYVELFDYKKVK